VNKTDHIIFCLSYLNVPITCQLIEHHSAENVKVISNIPNVIKLICELYPSGNTLLVESTSLKPFDIYNQKLFYRNKLNSIKNSNIYFFFVAYGILESYAIKMLSKQNKIFYKKSVDVSHFEDCSNIKANIWFKYLKLMLGVPFNPKSVDGKRIFAVSNEFLTMLNFKEFELPDNIGIIKKRIADKFQLKNKKILLAVGGIVEDDLVDEKEYIQKNDNLIKALSSYYGYNQITLKMHPRYKNLYSEEKKLDTIPSHLPGNLIIDQFDIIIGYCSAILFEAANKGKKVYSTLKYFNPLTVKTQYQYIEYLTSNLIVKSKIIFFQKLDDIEKDTVIID